MNFFKKRSKDEYAYDEDFIDNEDYGYKESGVAEEEAEDSSRSGVSFAGGSAPVALKVVKPKSFDEAPAIADYIAEGSTVLLNIENMDKVSTKRLIDFLLGATHVLGGTMNMVTNTTFVFAPKSVGVADLTANDEIEEATEDAYSEE
jgi:FtsZ-interacting cell division protein YlmF